MENAAESAVMPQPAPNLGVRVEIHVPIGHNQAMQTDAMVGTYMENGVPGQYAGTVVSAAIVKNEDRNKHYLCVVAELMDNAPGRELFEHARHNGNRPSHWRDHCVAHYNGIRTEEGVVANGFSCGPHGCGYVCDLRVISDYR